jgi:hypothetical protein
VGENSADAHVKAKVRDGSTKTGSSKWTPVGRTCRLPIPGILRAGGLPNAAALVAPHDLLLHNTGDVFDSTWAKAAYALYPGATLTAEKDRLQNDALIAFLDRSFLPGAGPME